LLSALEHVCASRMLTLNDGRVLHLTPLVLVKIRYSYSSTVHIMTDNE
jgi:hypothetical protein